jgi:hypothetical protein
MSLDSIVQLTISRQTTVVSRPGFGVPLIVAYHTKWPERVRTYTDLQGVVDDGFTTSDPVYMMASALMSQNPKVPKFAVGRRALAPTMTVVVTPAVRNATRYAVVIGSTTFEYTSDADATLAEITSAITSAINAASWQASTAYSVDAHVTNDDGKVYVCRTAGTSAAAGGPTGTGVGIVDGSCVWDYAGPEVAVTATDLGTRVALTADVPGSQFALVLEGGYGGDDLWIRKDVTADPGIAADMAAILLENPDWYGVLLDSNSAAEIEALAAWVEANKRLFVATCGDDDLHGPGSSDIVSILQAAAIERTGVIYHPKPHQRAATSWMGKVFPKDPGSITWKFKTLSGPAVTALTSTKISNLERKNCNHYTRVGGVNITQQGKTARPEYLDVIRFVDWLHANMQADVFELFVNSDKVPYTQGGADRVEAAIRRRLAEGVDVGGLRADPAPSVTAPSVVDVPDADKGDRHLPDMKFTAYLAGAIHSVRIDGVVSM